MKNSYSERYASRRTCNLIETSRRIVRRAARRMQRWPDLVSDEFSDRFLVLWLWHFPLAWVCRSPLIAVLLVALLVSGCATWCRVASGSVVIAEGMVQTWTAIARDACVPRSDRCREAEENVRSALAALIAARAAVLPCGPEPEDGAGFALAPMTRDVDLDALKEELDRLEKAAEEWRKP